MIHLTLNVLESGLVYVSQNQSQSVSQSTPLKRDNDGEDAKLVFLDFLLGQDMVHHVLTMCNQLRMLRQEQ